MIIVRNRLSQYYIYVLAIIVGLIAVHGNSLWIDEGIRVSYALPYKSAEEIFPRAASEKQLLYAYLEWIWGNTFGYSEVAIRLLNLPFFVIAVYYLCKILKQKDISRDFAFLYMLNPMIIYYLNECAPYIMLSAYSMAAIYYMFFAQKNSTTRNAVLTSILLLLGYLTHFIFGFFYFVYLCKILYALAEKKWRDLKKHLIVGASSLVLFVPITFVYLLNMTTGQERGWDMPGIKNLAYVVYSFLGMQGLSLSRNDFRGGFFSNITVEMIILLTAFMVSVIFILVINRKSFAKSLINNKLLIISLCSYVVVFIVCSMFMHFHFWERHLIPLFSGFVIIVCDVFSQATGNKKNKKCNLCFVAIIIVCIAVSVGNIRFNYYYQKDDYKGLISYLRNENHVEEIWVQGAVQCYNYYGISLKYPNGESADCFENVKVGSWTNVSGTEVEELVDLIDMYFARNDGRLMVALSNKLYDKKKQESLISELKEKYQVEINVDYNTFVLLNLNV